MSERAFAPPLLELIDAWHTSALPDKTIAPLESALKRYMELGVEVAAYRTAAAAGLANLASKVVDGEAAFADALVEWTTLSGGRRPGRGGDLDQTFFHECRRQARKATEIAAAAIDWPAILNAAGATHELQFAIRSAGLAR